MFTPLDNKRVKDRCQGLKDKCVECPPRVRCWLYEVNIIYSG